jgi:endonuclease/exonuclease/phosphatase family metal-dependent hydrolase
MSGIPIVPLERRKAMREMPATADTHQRLLREMPFLDDCETRLLSRGGEGGARSVKVVGWNAERCPRTDAASRFLGRQNADLLLLTEMDWGMARSGQRHTVGELAARLGYGYAFAVEYLELGLGDAYEREWHRGQENDVGYHGAAILFRQNPIETKVVRLELAGGWFDGQRGERRIGGRIALLARFRTSSGSATFATVHLESDSDPADRSAQMRRLFEAIDSFGAGKPALIAGDLNTFSVSCAELHSEESMRRALLEDPARLLDPTAHEPLFALARSFGYEWESCNQIGVPTQRLSPRSSSGLRRMKLDWFLSRGLAASGPEMVRADDPQDGSELSDHDAICVTVEGTVGMSQ